MAQIVIGRQPELARIEAFLAGIPLGARALVIEGEPGMGKTTLWLAGLAGAADRSLQVLSARPSEAEATFAYAGIGDLLGAADESALAPLPAPQQRALRVALLREEPEGRSPDPRTIAVAFLNALRGLAREGPVLVAIDDIQWLDSTSALALGFAIRRLGRDPVGFLLARRVEGHGPLPLGLDRALPGEPLDRITVGPLGLGALGEILHGRLGVRYPRAMLGHIHAVSGGNPLFTLELGRALGNEPATLEAGLDLPLPDELMSLLGRQLESLPAETQDALAVAAVLARPTVELVARTVDGPAEGRLQPALIAHVIEIDEGRIRFTHPLRAAAARSRASPGRRREIHALLASVVSDPEERARHLALAADGPDEATAAALEDAARRASARGAPDAASELAGLAGRLTPPDRLDDIRRRGLAEAEYATHAADHLRALEVAENLLATSPPGPARGEVLFLLGYIHLALDLRAAATFLRRALVEAGHDDRLRMRCEGALTAASELLGESVTESLAHGHAELELAERLGDEVSVATALRGIARNEQRMTGRMPAELIGRSLALEPLVAATRPITHWPSRCHAEMLAWTDDLAAGVRLWTELLSEAVERGEGHSISWILADLIPYECIGGAWAQALAHADECHDLAVVEHSSLLRAVAFAERALVEVHLGDAPAARRDADEARRLGAPLGAFVAERTAAWALGLLELSMGDPARAHEQLGPLVEGRRAAGVGEPGDMRFVTDEIEALIGLGRHAEAEALLDWYEGLAQASGRLFALAACDRCWGLLHAARGGHEAAIAALEASRTRYATIADPFGLGRTLLALGSIQRRALRRHAARETLEASLAAFEGLRAKLWSDRARAELGRIGGRHAAGDELTPAEQQVAALVAEGRTNREVATALVLSERTIEGHLSRIYAKLGVRSRAELAHLLTAEAEHPA